MDPKFFRQGQMAQHRVYFYTQTIIGFNHLLAEDWSKQIIIDSLKWLVDKNRVKINGFVIMPNHIHLIWYYNEIQVKESPIASFSKYTAHEFKNYLKKNNSNLLKLYSSDSEDRNYQFWKRDGLAIPISTEEILIQKLKYIHENPIKEKWKLCLYPEDYKWSSARFYYFNEDDFGMLSDFY